MISVQIVGKHEGVHNYTIMYALRFNMPEPSAKSS